ncbi:precorrin-2 C(20)-methyltransferase [Ruegeria arenilitoris]|uniref:precorrin-2 C(20)-methyltransferase n=1 Tax=Ruegeria arenilitoris TaxID=1173585 RepID=UPI00147BDCB6|nr:precorrin-2 C(20)-methyltransferase [Ruegeria arenilitoris]
MSAGTIYGVGLGPGDPDLISVRADRLLRNSRHVAFFRKPGRSGQARNIVNGIIPRDAVEFPMEYPVTTEIPIQDPRYNELLSAFYESCAAHLKSITDRGDDVVVLCEGDPFFYGSFMHLYSRLREYSKVEIVPAITGMSGAWTATGDPITWGDDILTVLVGTLPEEVLTERMAQTDALVVMKIGRNIDKVKRSLQSAGLYDRAWIVEYAQMPNQRVCKLSENCEGITPYFSIIIVHGQGRRP